jgi:hypothetical protein
MPKERKLAAAFAAGLTLGVVFALWPGGDDGGQRTARLIAALASPAEDAGDRLEAVEHLDRLPARDRLSAQLLYDIARGDEDHGVRLAALEALLPRGRRLAAGATESIDWDRLESPEEQLAWIELVLANGNPRAMPALDRFVRSRQSLAQLDPRVAERAHQALIVLRCGG